MYKLHAKDWVSTLLLPIPRGWDISLRFRIFLYWLRLAPTNKVSGQQGAVQQNAKRECIGGERDSEEDGRS